MRHITIPALTMSAIIITAVYASADDSRVRGDGFHLLEDPVAPRSVAMGTAGTALGGAGFRYYNPARPFFTEQSFSAAEFGQLPGGVNKGGFELALIQPLWYYAADFYTSSVDFETRDERGFGYAAKMSTTLGAMTLGYVRDKFSLAVAATMIEDRIWVESNYGAFALSGGLGYKFLDGKLNVGAAGFHGIARSRGFGEDPNRWREGRVPRAARGGAAWIDTLKSIPYTFAADVVYRDEDDSFSAPVGLEVKVLPYIDLRIGKRIGWETEIMSFGIGINNDKMSFDAAFVPSVFVNDYEMKWNMSFTYRLGMEPKRREIKFPPVKITAGDDDDDGEDVEGDDTTAGSGDTAGVADTVGNADAEEVADTVTTDVTEDTDPARTDAEVSDDGKQDDDVSEDIAPESAEPAPPKTDLGNGDAPASDTPRADAGESAPEPSEENVD